jgi:hypothetical protein
MSQTFFLHQSRSTRVGPGLTQKDMQCWKCLLGKNGLAYFWRNIIEAEEEQFNDILTRETAGSSSSAEKKKVKSEIS